MRTLRIWVLVQPSLFPRTSPNTSRNSPPEKVTTPGTSMPPCAGSRDSSTFSSVTTSAATPIGTLTRKIQRQPSDSVIRPPTSGPIATAPPVVAPQIPNAVPRSLPWNSWASSASETANIVAPPTPCRPRARMRKFAPGATPQSSEPPVNTITPTAKTDLRPSRSASEPAVSVSAASESA